MVAIDKYTLKQLKGLARKRGLSTKGKRGDLINRLRPRKNKKGRAAQPRIPMHYYSEELNTLKIGRGKPLIRQRRIAIIPKDLQIEERKNAVRHLINNQTAQLVNLREQGKLTQEQLGTAIDKINDLHNIETERRQRRSVSARKGAETRRTEREQRRQLELMEQRARDKNRELESDGDIEMEAKRFTMRQRAEERKRAFEKNKALMSVGDSESDAKAARDEFRETLRQRTKERMERDIQGRAEKNKAIALLQRKMAEDDEAMAVAEPKAMAVAEPKPKRADSGMVSGTEGRDRRRIRRRLRIVEPKPDKPKKQPERLKRATIRLESGESVPLAFPLREEDDEEAKRAPVAEAILSTGDPNV